MAIKLNDVLASDHLPTLPAAAMQVLDLARAPEPNIKKLVVAIKSDPALAVRILRTANSSLFGLRQHVTAIEQAVPLLGTMAVSSLVLGFSLAAQSMHPGPVAEHYQRVWSRSLVQAVAAESLCRHFRLGVTAEYFVAGLIQDVGMLALLHTAADQYVGALGEFESESQKTIVDIERERLGFSHVDVSTHLCTRWKLPEAIRRAISTHHSSPADLEKLTPDESRLGIALAAAAVISEFFCRSSKQAARGVVEELMKKHYRLEGDGLHSLLAEIDTNVREAAELFSLDLGELPPYEEILARANAELADIALRAQLASIQAGELAQAARRELSELADQTESLRTQACRDSLTSVYNRGFFEEVLEREYSRCIRYGGSLGLIFLDLDHFKQVNDQFGHLFGDEVLKRAAQSILACVRESDVVARFGGEEFVILLINLGELDLKASAERMRQAIESLSLRCRDEVVRVTASLGATLLLPMTSAPPDRSRLVELADSAMYDAKRSGRNQVRFATCA